MLTDKVAVITGGATGIGRAIAVKLAEAGAKIVILYIGDPDVVTDLKNELGDSLTAISADVSNPDQVTAAISEVVSTFGRLDILVNNAGITKDNLLLRMKPEDWDQVLDINLKGVFLCTKAVARPMIKARYGRIINISSVVGVMGNAGQANYSASKAGVIGLTKTVARELAGRGITVNAVAPGYIETRMTANLASDIQDKLRSNIPLERLGTADDVANLVKFLASDDASYITGQNIHVDGGLVM